MLVLTIKPNERIIIDGGISLTLCEILCVNQALLSIEAPLSTGVWRGEVYDEMFRRGNVKPDPGIDRQEGIRVLLRRKPQEKIVIAGGIVVTVVREHEGFIKIGVDAPKHIAVNRERLLKKKAKES